VCHFSFVGIGKNPNCSLDTIRKERRTLIILAVETKERKQEGRKRRNSAAEKLVIKRTEAERGR
jgi:uncharacterized protein YaaN involved in tellurite resistance